ncbi:MAG: DUF6785 family protein [Candidatus Latescibacterota bacterium]
MTPRALCLGVGMVLVVALGAFYSPWIVGAAEITWSYFPVAVGTPFVLLVLVNALIKRLLGRALQPAELLTVLMMGLVATSIPLWIVGYLLAILAAPYYAATPENDWANLVHPYLPAWAIPQNEGDAMRWFFEGMPAGQSIPYAVWIGPLSWWLSLILTVYFVCFCVVTILRRQWVEREKLPFPLMELPRGLVEEDGQPLLRSAAFRAGCALSAALILYDIIGNFHPGFPQIDVGRGPVFQIDPDFPDLHMNLRLPVLGFMFLASTQISFSIWVFYLVAFVQEGVTNMIGYEVSSADPFVWGMQSLSWQSWGAFTVMVLLSLWMGRQHVTAVFRHAFSRTGSLDDRREMMSYRIAVYGLLAGLAYVVWWLQRLGMELPIACLFVFGVMVAYIGITRLVIQTGLFYLTTPVVSQAFTLAITGTGIAPPNLVALCLSYTWFGDVQSIFMTSVAHATRLGERGGRSRLLGLAIGLAVVVGFGAAICFLLYLCYRYGGGNFVSWIYRAGAGAGGMAFDSVAGHLVNPSPTDWTKLSYFGIGAVVYAGLAACQYRFYWWPLHPAGFPVGTLWMIRDIALSIVLAWAIKTAVLHYGGIGAYRRVRPFFLGLVVGFFLGVGVSFVVDWIFFFGKGHRVV